MGDVGKLWMRDRCFERVIRLYGKQDQRTDAWHTQRGTMITASEVSKVWTTPASRLELLLKKLEPPAKTENNAFNSVPALIWGTRFEPVAKKIYEQSLTVREVEELIAKVTDGKRSEKSKSSRDPSIVMMESRIRTKFSAKVSVSHNEKSGKGKIVLSYANMNELDRILEKMGIR